MSSPAELDRARRAVYEALKVSAPSGFTEERRRHFLDEGQELRLADLDMDSLALMEFCISVELSTGVSLLPVQLVELANTGAIETRIREQLP